MTKAGRLLGLKIYLELKPSPMTAPKTIIGRWRGTYFYDNIEQRPLDGGGVNFELQLSQTRWERLLGRFSGTVIDDSSRGMPGLGTIRGKLNGASIRFTKQMPVLYVGSSEHSRPLSTYVREQGYELGCDFSHPPIIYTGNFTRDEEASGTWLLETETMPISPDVELRFPRGTGTFSLAR